MVDLQFFLGSGELWLRSDICNQAASKSSHGVWRLSLPTLMRAEPRRLIIPVFFGVKPSHVGNLNGPLKRKFESYENNEELKQQVSDWKNALSEVGKIPGFNLKDANGYALSHLSPLFSP
ncbi:hypothetical protein EJ110_NYTH22097 [Nymphaea thermarum]|nr:hypothetical protein EJ110_NYTH22097 [Nymphaea thermarum]